MKGNAEVLEALSDMLKEELGAINQYFLHAEMCENWGYKRLAELTKKQAIGEMNEIGQINIGKDVPGQLKNDLALEKGAVAAYNKAVEVCRKAADNATADFLKEILKDEEEHVDYLETQLSLIEQLTLPIYLTEQMKG